MRKIFRIEAVETVANRLRWNVTVEGGPGMSEDDWRDAALDAFHNGNRVCACTKESEVIEMDVTAGPFELDIGVA